MKAACATLAAALAWSPLAAPLARADNPVSPTTPSLPAATTARADEAAVRFRRGVDLYAEGDLSAALVEFTRAYDLVPRYKILYNIAQITYQQQDYVSAVRHFRRYLADGGDEVPPARRREVQQEIHRLEQRVGKLDIQAPAADLRVIVDGVDVGATPLATPVEANVGRRHVEVQSPTGQRWSRFVDLAGGDTIAVAFPSSSALNLTSGRRMPEDAPLPLLSLIDVRSDSPPPAARRPWLAWTGTAVLAVGAAVAGGVAWQASRDLDSARRTYPVSPDELQRLADRTRTFSLIADGTAVGALLMAGVSTYLTLRGSGRRTGGESLSLNY